MKTEISRGAQNMWDKGYDRVRPDKRCNKMHPMFAMSMPPVKVIKIMIREDALSNYMSNHWFEAPQPEVQPVVQVVDMSAEHKSRPPR